MKVIEVKDLRTITSWDEFWALGRYTRCQWRKVGVGLWGEISSSVQLQEDTRLIFQDGTEEIVPARTQLGWRKDRTFFTVVPGSSWEGSWELIVDQTADDPGVPPFEF